jgi:tartrate-resistant acid phosphatase type 5
MGDYGVGMRADAESSRRQRRIAEVLERLVADHEVRFVLSLGDNVYQGEQGRVDQEGGGEDDDWYSSFFQPYRLAIARVPIFPAIGNHDSADSEAAMTVPRWRTTSTSASASTTASRRRQ